MELNYWVLIVTINLLFATDVLCVKKSKLEAKFNALDSLVRGELYFLKDTIETDRQERKELIKKLNETLEFLEISRGDRVPVNKLQVDTNNGGIQKELKTLSLKLEQNNNAISQLAESHVHTKRGLMEEKKERKADAAAVITELIQIQKTLNDLSNNQQESIKYQKELDKNQHESIKIQNGIIKNQNKLVNNVTDMRNEIITNQDDQVDNINVIATKTDALQNTTADLRDKYDMLEQTLKNELSKCTEMTNNTIQEHVLQVSDIAEATEEVKAAVASTLFCSIQKAVEACLHKHFESTVLQTIQTIGSVRLAGGRNQYEGRVEVDIKGMNGTVCDDIWSSSEARVVCRMLGFTGGTAFQGPRNSAGHSFGGGTGEILLDDVKCTGDEVSIFTCRHNGIGVENCNHSEDAGVRCDP